MRSGNWLSVSRPSAIERAGRSAESRAPSGPMRHHCSEPRRGSRLMVASATDRSRGSLATGDPTVLDQQCGRRGACGCTAQDGARHRRRQCGTRSRHIGSRARLQATSASRLRSRRIVVSWLREIGAGSAHQPGPPGTWSANHFRRAGGPN
jgi:hypothetical protein